MAAFTKHPAGGWRAAVDLNGTRASKVHPTKKAAELWAIDKEAEILAGRAGKYPRKTYDQAITRYEETICDRKAGGTWERRRFKLLRKNFPALVAMQLTEITTDDLTQWKDERLKTVTGSTVNREITVLRHVFSTARKSWKWMGESPFTGFAHPEVSIPRSQRVARQDIKTMLRQLDHVPGQPPQTLKQEVALAFLISLRTGLRAQEVYWLKDADVARLPGGTVLTVHKHKMFYKTKAPRVVPISTRAAKLIARLQGRGNLFRIKKEVGCTYFIAAKRRAGIAGIQFRDSRAEAFFTLANNKKNPINVMQLAKISGHKDTKMLNAVYYREDSESIAAALG